eukprot:6991540-Prymnesium_polylepis.1
MLSPRFSNTSTAVVSQANHTHRLRCKRLVPLPSLLSPALVPCSVRRLAPMPPAAFLGEPSYGALHMVPSSRAGPPPSYGSP